MAGEVQRSQRRSFRLSSLSAPTHTRLWDFATLLWNLNALLEPKNLAPYLGLIDRARLFWKFILFRESINSNSCPRQSAVDTAIEFFE